MSEAPTELILYACPTGPLADQLDRYFAHSRAQIGENTAHLYMPHCTLTGFFHDLPATIPAYLAVLERLLADSRPPKPVLTMQSLTLAPEFHGLELDSPYLRQFTRDFVAHAESSTRTDAIRPKDWLHLSLAYGFPAEQHAPLRELAEAMITLSAPAAWELRFYERQPGHHWTLHGAFPV